MKPFTSSLLLVLVCLALLAPGGSGAAFTQAVLASDSLLSPLPNWVTDGEENGVDYGISVASAGDVNNDGYADVIVGAQKYKIDDERTGAAFVFLGGAGGVSYTAHRQLSSRVNGSLFGNSVSSAGDVNKDGFDDVIVGASHHHATTGYDGAAYLYLGGEAGLSADPVWSKVGLLGDSEFGHAVSCAGDVNKDGYDDVLIGARTHSHDQSNEGAAFLFLGTASGLSTEPVWTYESDQAGAQLGYALAPLGDLNRDGYADVVVAAPFFDSGEENEGAVFIFMGSPDGLGETPSWQAYGEQIDARFGTSVAGAGDVDLNGYPDLLVGARGYDTALIDAGAAYLFLNSSTGLGETARWMVSGSQAYSGFGNSVAGIGDVDLDGYSDLAVGAPRMSGDQSLEGYVYLYRGAPDEVHTTPSWYSSGNKAETDYGYSIASAGDVNGDGKPDLIIGAPIYKRDEKTVMGRAYVYLAADPGETNTHYLHLPMIVVNP